MKKKLLKANTLFLSAVFSFFTNFLHAQEAYVQFVHNSSDPSVAIVDIYFSDTLAIDDFEYRNATKYFTLPSDVPVKISIAPSASTSSAEAIFNANYTFGLKTKNIMMASGLVEAGFAANPQGRATDFQFLNFPAAKTTSTDPDKVELVWFNGVTDAHVLDLALPTNEVIFNNLGYGNAAAYVLRDPSISTVWVQNYFNQTTFGAFSTDFSVLTGDAVFLLLSGFMDPVANKNGASLALLGIMPDGSVISFNEEDVVVTSMQKSQEENAGLKIYPMPSQGIVNIKLTDIQVEGSIEVLNLQGMSMKKINRADYNSVNELTLDLSELTPGNYFIKLISGDKYIVENLIIAD